MTVAIGEDAGMDVPLPSITLQFLAWVAARPRRYAEAMEAWRTSCPRLSVWEDATGEGLVRVVATGGARTHGEAAVVLTERGAARLAAVARTGDAHRAPEAFAGATGQ
jgi:hypothetical protein